MDQQARDNFITMVLKAATVDDHDSLFAIGPFGSRVSFASQQRRALNTVWALEQQGKIKDGAKVAVIGGGLAGVTASVALAAKKCLVHMYEAGPRVMSIQRAANHRYLHPTINFWPEIELSPTTQFPFFDWRADKCSQIVDGLFEEWERYFKRRVKTYLNSRVQELVKDGQSLVVKAAGGLPTPTAPFDCVILTVGFGAEKTVSGIDYPSYWTMDDIANEEGTVQHKLVSGAGDGGLIEALRIVHTNFRAGRLCEEIVRALDETGIPTHLRTLEADVANRYDMDFEGGAEKASLDYSTGYDALLEDLPDFVLDTLTNSLRKDLTLPILLIGQTSRPYSLTSAPIHKLLLAHAMRQGKIEYKKGELTAGPTLTVNGVEQPLPGSCVIRHGPTCDVAGLLSPEQIKSLKTRQTGFSDIILGAPYDGAYWRNWSDYPEQNFQNPAFVDFRHRAASMYIMEEFSEHLFKTNELTGAQYFVEQKPGGPDLSKMIPKKLFGIKTDVRSPRVYVP